ncbi:MAG: 6-pyruvoyl tetrahydropterin synthase family protein [Candidatus Midichloria sp.]|uniref:6-pyruvoyltetrahydropterin synthase n=1 Tax=Hyalomma marginatum TaxID=34627 RepID=A0A8S4C188_9ACAR|nr:6-carboxytetrahydropterin synthase [Hyalomma marginatum]CAG7590377.1 6-carboxytetrahydropterin synthase [Hyalomma marginatum]
MISCTRKIEFDAAHRVVGHQGKCYKLHGHRYTVEATFVAKELSDIGIVIDFSDIKEKLGGWVDKNWDHNTILNISDKILGDQISNNIEQTIYYLNQNPTAENMAKYLIHVICPQLFKDSEIKCIKIRLYETPNCYAEVEEQ